MIEPLALSTLPAPELPERRAEPMPPADTDEVPLFQGLDVRVTSERLVAHGRAWPLAEVSHVDSVRRSPRIWPLLAAMGSSGMVGLPLATSLLGSGTGARGYAEAVLVGVALVFFTCLAGLMTAEDTYWLVLGLPGGARAVFASRDAQLVSRLASTVDEALAARRQR